MLTLSPHGMNSSESLDRETLENLFWLHLPTPPDSLRYRRYQILAARWLVLRNAAILAMDPGLGKTVAAIAALSVLKPRLCLVVCPVSVKNVWTYELSRWYPTLCPVVLDEPADSGVVITNYEKLVGRGNRKFSEFFYSLCEKNYSVLILDESHYLQNLKSKRTAACLALGEKAERVYCLTGTPMLSRPRDLIPQLLLMKKKADVETWKFWKIRDSGFVRLFERRYCDGHLEKIRIAGGDYRVVWKNDGVSNLQELHHKLFWLMFRKQKHEVANELPPKSRQIVYVTATGEAEKLLAEEKDLTQAFADIQSLARSAIKPRLAEVRRKLGLLKVETFLDHIISLASQTKIAVWAHHRDVIETLEKKLAVFNPAVIVGGDSEGWRMKAIQKFQEEDSCRVFIGSMHAAGQGITLTATSTAVFLELDYTPAIMLQAEDRHHRIGQTNPLLVQYLVYRDSLDHRIAMILRDKSWAISTVVDGNGAVQRL